MVLYLLLDCEKNEIKQKEAEIENMSDKVWLDNLSNISPFTSMKIWLIV